MAHMYYETDGDISLLGDKTIGIIGYGSQGHAHALNLKDNGIDVLVGLYEGSKSWKKAEGDGLVVKTVAEVAKESDIIMILIPDTSQPAVYEESIRDHLHHGKVLMFAHGFNIHFKTIIPPTDIDAPPVLPPVMPPPVVTPPPRPRPVTPAWVFTLLRTVLATLVVAGLAVGMIFLFRQFGWQGVWKVTLIGTCGLFAVLSIWSS